MGVGVAVGCCGGGEDDDDDEMVVLSLCVAETIWGREWAVMGPR